MESQALALRRAYDAVACSSRHPFYTRGVTRDQGLLPPNSGVVVKSLVADNTQAFDNVTFTLSHPLPI